MGCIAVADGASLGSETIQENSSMTRTSTTLIARGAGAPYREWCPSSGERRVIVVDTFSAACETLNHAADRELREVILDHCTTPQGFLTLLSNLPAEFLGDVL